MTRREAIAPEWRERLEAGGLPVLAALLDGRAGANGLRGELELLSKPGLGGRQRWRWKLPGNGRTEELYVKVYTRTSLRTQIDRICRQDARRSRAWWEFAQSQRLAEAQIGAPHPVAFVEEMRGRFERRSAVILSGVPGEALDRLWLRLCAEGAPITRGPLRHDLTVRLARFASAFHSTGFCHRDLYLCHIFAELDREGRAAPGFALIDLARTCRPRLRRLRWIVKDLSQLDCSARQIGATRTDRLRFLLAYLGLQRVSERTRLYVRRIVRKSDAILNRIARKSTG